jgi:hypothetical protein
VLAFRLIVFPAQIGLLEEAVGAVGAGRITTVVVPDPLGQPATFTVNEYVPAAALVTLGMLGF